MAPWCLVAAACGGGGTSPQPMIDAGGNPDAGVDGPVQGAGGIRGVVTSAQANGEDVVAEATVSVVGGASAVTDGHGAFAITPVAPGDVVLRVAGPADSPAVFGTTEIRVSVAAGQTLDLRIGLLPGCQRIFDSAQGATLTLSGCGAGGGAATLTFDPGDVAEAGGAPFQGAVRAEIAIHDPAVPAQLAALPVDLRADPRSARAIYGAIEVRLSDALTGRALQVAPGESVGVRIEAVDPGVGVVPVLSRYDEVQGAWIDEPAGTLEPGTPAHYAFEASHFTMRTVNNPGALWSRGAACLRMPTMADLSFAVDRLWVETSVGVLFVERNPVDGKFLVPAQLTIEAVRAQVSVLVAGTGVVTYSGEIRVDDAFEPTAGSDCNDVSPMTLSAPADACLSGSFDHMHCAGQSPCSVYARRALGGIVAAAPASCTTTTCTFCLDGPRSAEVDVVLPSGARFGAEDFSSTALMCSPTPSVCPAVGSTPILGPDYVQAALSVQVTPQGNGFELALDASGTVGQINVFEWRIFDDDGLAIFAATTASAQHVATVGAGAYRVRVRAYGRSGALSAAEQQVSVGGVPIASFTATPSATPGDLTVAVDASASTDDGTIVSYEWDFEDDGSFDAMGQTRSITYSTAGTRRIRLRVTDDDGLTGETTRDVIVGSPSVTLTIVVVGQGTVLDWNTEQTVCSHLLGTPPGTCARTFTLPLGQPLRYFTTPVQSWRFDRWVGCDAFDPATRLCTVNPIVDRTIQAMFTAIPN